MAIGIRGGCVACWAHLFKADTTDAQPKGKAALTLGRVGTFGFVDVVPEPAENAGIVTTWREIS